MILHLFVSTEFVSTERYDKIKFFRCGKCSRRFMISRNMAEGKYSTLAPFAYNKQWTQCEISDEEYKMRELLK